MNDLHLAFDNLNLAADDAEPGMEVPQVQLDDEEEKHADNEGLNAEMLGNLLF